MFKIARDLKNQTDPTFKFLDHYSITPDLASNIINKVLLRWCNGKESTCQCRGCGRHENSLEEMATHSHILAWKIPWTDEPGRLQSMGLLRLEHDRAHPS